MMHKPVRQSVRVIILMICIFCYIINYAPAAENTGRPEIKIQMGHSSSIEAVTYSHNGKYVASWSGDEMLKIWDVTLGKEIRSISNIKVSAGGSIIFSPDDRYIVAGSGEGAFALWETATGQAVKTFNGHKASVRYVSFSPDGKYLISFSDDETVKMWDIASGSVVKTFRGHKGPVLSVRFAPDSKFILYGQDDNSIVLWDIASGRAVRTFTGHTGTVNSADFSSDGRYIVSGSSDYTVRLWDVVSGKEVRVFKGHSYNVCSVKFSPDGRFIASGSMDEAVIVWDISSEKPFKVLSGVEGTVHSLAYSPDGKYIISTSRRNASVTNDYNSYYNLNLWDVKSGKKIRTFASYQDLIQAVSFSPDGRFIASGSMDNTVRVWDISSGKRAWTLTGHTHWVNSVEFSPDGKYIVSSCDDGTARLWDMSSGREVRRLGLWGPVNTAFFSPDGKFIITGSMEESGGVTLVLWEAATGNRIRNFAITKTVSSALFSPDGKSLLINSEELKLIDAVSGSDIRIFKGYPEYVIRPVFSPDGKYIAAGSSDKTILLWDVASGETIRTFTGHTGNITSVAFSPDGKYIISGSSDKTVRLWDAGSGNEVKVFSGHSEVIQSVRFSPDGKYILSGSNDSTTRLWNVETGDWVAFINHPNGKDWLIFDSDGCWDSSRHGGDLVAMVQGMNCWNVDQFAVKNNRPDLILAKLPLPDGEMIYEYNRQYKKRVSKLERLYGIKETDLVSGMHVPLVEILKADRRSETLELSMKFSDSEYDIVSYNIYVNDVPVYTEIGKKIERTGEIVVSEKVELSSGENKVEVSCFNVKGTESYRASVLADCEGKKKGSLYFIGFGVADYADASITDLRYSENDVLDLAEKFSSMKGQYDKIYIKTCTGRDVTPVNIKSAKEFVKKAEVDDTVVLFISGHGMHDSDEYRTYYYLTQNTDLKNLKGTAADFGTIEDILAGISPRKKLFLMDTCDSGELDDFTGEKHSAVNGKNIRGVPRTPRGMVIEYTGNRGYFDRGRYIYNDLFRRTGAVVFSSSMGGEASWEFDSLKNGAFTEAILEALSGRADTDNNGFVTIDELKEYVGQSVNNLTDGMQHPVIDRDNIYINIELPVQ